NPRVDSARLGATKATSGHQSGTLPASSSSAQICSTRDAMLMIRQVSPDPELHVVTVVGAGFLGRQIAAMCAASDRQVRLVDADPAAADGARDWLRAWLTDPVTAGELDWDLDAVLARIEP